MRFCVSEEQSDEFTRSGIISSCLQWLDDLLSVPLLLKTYYSVFR